MSFEILDYLDALESDGGSNDPRGDQSFHCPACGANNFKVNLKTGRWSTFSCDCANTEYGKRRIRNALSPAINPSARTIRPRSKREWTYNDHAGQPVIKVHRFDDGDGNRRIRQESLVPSQRPAELTAIAAPCGLKHAQQALADGAPWVFWVEGEPCCDALRNLGLAAVTNIGGSGKFNPERDGPKATGIPPQQLVVVPDRDKPGIKHAEQVAAAYPGCQWLYPFPGSPQWNVSCPESGGLDIADWIRAGATAEQIIEGIGPQSTPEPEAQPSGEAQGDIRDDFLRDAESLKARLDRGLQQIDEIPNVATRSVALHTLRSSLGLGKPEFEALILQLSEAKAPKAVESFDDLMAEDDEDLTALVEDLFPTGLILIAAEGFAGKSNTAYQIAEAVTNGSKFAGQFQCQQAPVLLIQMDESKTDAKRKGKVLGLRPAKGALTVKWHFSPMMFPELRRWVQESGSKLVILDSLLTIAGGTISPKDAEFGLLIYRLNQLAAELRLTILCLHHVVKARGGKARTEVLKEDIFGTAYVYNGASEAWGLWQSREDGNPEPVFNLRNLKARSGLVDQGTTYQFLGNDEDKRLTYRGMAGRTITLDQIKSTRQRVISLLQSAGGAALDPKTVNDRLQLGNPSYARRLCRELYEAPSVPVGRKDGSSGGGRPAYLYFWAGSENSYIQVSKVSKVPQPSHSKGSQGVKLSVLSAHPAEPSDTLSARNEDFLQTFGTERDPSEREESEGIEEGFRYEHPLTREEPPHPEIFDF